MIYRGENLEGIFSGTGGGHEVYGGGDGTELGGKKIKKSYSIKQIKKIYPRVLLLLVYNNNNNSGTGMLCARGEEEST